MQAHDPDRNDFITGNVKEAVFHVVFSFYHVNA